jgi:putative DNA primase/helicase
MAARVEPTSTSVGFSPFHVAALDYFKAGFLPFPLPIAKKSPPPKGVPNSIDITQDKILEWLEDPKPRNIGCVVPDGLIVIDVDGLPGKETLRELESRYGDLNSTWISFRGDPDRYHLWYATTPGVVWPGKLGTGVDIIYRHYRYMVLPPSIHPDGQQYRWVGPNGHSEYANYLPATEEFHDLSRKWSVLATGKGYVYRDRAEVDSRLWLAEHGGSSSDAICPELRRVVVRHQKLIRLGAAGGGMHDAMLNAVWAVLAEISAGHKGGFAALGRIKNTFFEQADDSGRRDEESMTAEWARACIGGIEQTAVERVRQDDPCVVEEAERDKDPNRFFDPKFGLKARSLRLAVERTGKLAVGPGGSIYRFSEGVWVPDGRSEIVRRTERLMRQRYRPAHAANVENVIASREPFINDDAQDTRYLNLPNGLLDWREGKLYPHNPAVVSTTRIPIEWDEDAECPEVDKFFSEVFPSDAAELATEILGYMLYNDNPLHKAVLLHGSGRNGKGTFIRLARALVGGNNISAITPQDLDGSVFASAQLHGKLANLVGDVDPRIFKSTERFKQLTGGDYMPAQHKFGQPFVFRCRALMVAAFNSLPRTADTTEGFFSRWIVVPFKGFYPAGKADTGLIHRLTAPQELQGLLRASVAGLQSLLNRGAFRMPESVRLATEHFRIEADPIRGYIAERIRTARSESEWVNRTELYADYVAWAGTNGFQQMSNSRFYESLAPALLDAHPHATPTRRDGWDGYRGIEMTK